VKRCARPLGIATLALALGGCSGRSCTGRSGGPPAPGATQSAAAEVVVPYGCAGLGPEGACSSPPAPTDALVHVAERLAELAALHRPPGEDWWRPVSAAVDAAGAAAAPSTDRERALVQNAALHVAIAANRTHREIALRAVAIVRRLAPPASAHDAAPEPEGLEAWLGPPGEWAERTHAGPFLHESVESQTRFVRLVLAERAPGGLVRAVFSQLVGVDEKGAPFVTNVVGHLEIRRGRTTAAEACVVLADPGRARCGAASALAAVAPTAVALLPSTHFFRHDDRGGLACNDCHELGRSEPSARPDRALGADIVTLERGEPTRRALAERRAALLERLRVTLDPLFR